LGRGKAKGENGKAMVFFENNCFKQGGKWGKETVEGQGYKELKGGREKPKNRELQSLKMEL